MSKIDRIIEYLKEFYKHHPNEAAGFYLGIGHPTGGWSDRFVSFEELEKGELPLDDETLNNADIYHSIFPFSGNKGRKKENAIGVTNYFIIDFDKEGHQKPTDEELRELASRTVEWFKEKGIDTAVKLSGTGLHIYIKTKIDLNDERHRELYENMRPLFKVLLPEGWESDNSIKDKARVIRVPYTRNFNHAGGKMVIWFNKDISELQETPFEKLWALYEELKAIYEKEQKAKRETEKEFETEGVLELDDEKLRELAKELVLLWKDYWVTGVRHYLSLALAGFIRKNTALTQEQAEELFSEFLALIGDEESRDRLRALADSYSKKEIASVSILLKKTEDKYELTGVGKTLASVLRLSDEEMVERLVKLFEDTREVFQKFAIARLKRSLIGREYIDKSDKRLVAVEVYRNRVVVAYYVKPEDKFIRARESVAISSRVRLLDALILHDEDSTIELYSIRFDNELNSFELREKTIREIADRLENSIIASAKSKNELIRVLQATIKILMKTYDIRYRHIFNAFEVFWDEFDKRYYMRPAFINSDDEKVVDLEKVLNNLNAEDFERLIGIFNDIRDDKLFLALVGQIFSTPFNAETRLKPILWIWSYAAGLGKSTVTSRLLEKMFLIEAKSVDALGSESTPYRFLRAAENRLPLVIDDVESIPPSFMNILKAYATGVELFMRGTGKARRDVKFRTRASLIISANSPFAAGTDSVMARIINIEVDDYVFRHSSTVKEIQELKGGIGFGFIKLIKDHLNELNRRFRDYVEVYAKTITVEMDERRKLIWAQLIAGLSLLTAVVEKFNDGGWSEEFAEFSRRARLVLENYNALIEEIEDRGAVGDILIDAVQNLIGATELIDNEKGAAYITTTDFARLKQTDPALKNFTSLWALMNEINKLAEELIGKRVAKRTRVELNGKRVNVLKIDRKAFDELRDESALRIDLPAIKEIEPEAIETEA